MGLMFKTFFKKKNEKKIITKIIHSLIIVYAAFADNLLTNSFIFSVDKDLGRSIGRPRPRSQTKEANTPRARDTPNNTV